MAEVSASRATTHRRIQDMSYNCQIPCVKPLDIIRSVLPGQQRKRTGLLLSSPKYSFIYYTNCLRSSVKFLQSLIIWGAMVSTGDGPLCFIKSKIIAAICQELLEHFMHLSADKLYGDTDFIFQQDFAPVHTAKSTATWFNHIGITVFHWSGHSPDLKVNRKMRDTRSNKADELKAAIKATLASITPQYHRLIASMPRIDAVIHAKKP